MIPQTELDLGSRAAERERYVIHALELYMKNTGYKYFHLHVPESISSGNSAWGYLKYPQDKEYPEKKQWKNTVFRNQCISHAIQDLKLWGIFEPDPQYYYRTHSELYKLREHNITDIQFGLYASKRIYRVLVEMSQFNSIKDYKMFGRTITSKKQSWNPDGFQASFYKCKLHRYRPIEVDDLIEYQLIDRTDGSKGYRLYSITEHGKNFMKNNQQYTNREYKIMGILPGGYSDQNIGTEEMYK